MATPQELISLFGDDFDEVLKGLNALPPEVKKLLDDTLGKLVYDAEVFGQRINKAVQTRGARGISLSNISGSLATDMQNKGRIFGELKNSIKESLVEGVNQSGQAGTFQAYDPDEKTIFTWITVAGHKICGDCSPRGGQKATLAEWEEQGMPATGWSVCGGYCYCILDPSGKLSPRIEFQEVQEKGATIRPKPTPPAAPLPKPTPLPNPVTQSKGLQKSGLRSKNLSTQQRLENLLRDDALPPHLKKHFTGKPTTFGGRIIDKYGKINFKGVSKANLEIITDALEDTLGRYNIKVNHLGLFNRKMKARNANAAAWGRGEKRNNFILGWKRDYVTNRMKNRDIKRRNWKFKRDQLITNMELTLKRIEEGVKNKTIFGAEKRIKEIKEQIKLYKNPNFNKWSISSVADDSLYATTKHESWHQIDYQLGKEPLTGFHDETAGGLFGTKLKQNGVTRNDWYLVSEYAGHNHAELWAETGTALDLGFYVPESIKKAFIATIEEVGQTYP